MRPALEFVEVRRITGLPQPVRGLSFAASEAQITAAVSRSVALKSTITGMATGQITPRDGAVLVFGEDISRARGLRLRALRRQVATVGAPGVGDAGDGLHLEDGRTVGATLKRGGRRYLDVLALADVAREQVGALPLHLRRRVALGRALAGPAALIVVNGFDLCTDADEALGLGAVLEQERDRTGRTFVLLCRHRRVAERVAEDVVDLVVDTRELVSARR